MQSAMEVILRQFVKVLLSNIDYCADQFFKAKNAIAANLTK